MGSPRNHTATINFVDNIFLIRDYPQNDTGGRTLPLCHYNGMYY